MSNWKVLFVLSVLSMGMLYPLATMETGGTVITKLSDGSQSKDISVQTGGGTNSNYGFELPKTATVTDARFNVTGLPSTTGEYPRGVTIDVGDDGDSEWSFAGEGYGPLCNQNMFSDNSTQIDLDFGGPGFFNNDTIYLPKNAVVTNATLNVTGYGGVSGPATTYVNRTNFNTAMAGIPINTQADFETHPLGVLASNFYANIGISAMTTTSGTIMNTAGPANGNTAGAIPGEGLHPVSRCLSPIAVGGSFGLTFTDPVTGAGLIVVDKFTGPGMTLTAYDGPAGTGTIVATATAPTNNYQNNNMVFLGIIDGSSSIKSLVYFNPGNGGDTVAIDDIRFGGGGPGPDNCSVDIGDNGAIEWNITGHINQTYTLPDFAAELNSIITTSPVAFNDAWGNAMVEIPINVSANSTGFVRLEDLSIKYNYTTTVDINPYSGNLTNELNQVLPHTGGGNMSIPLAISCVSGGVVNITDIFIDYYVPPVTNDALYLTNGRGTDGKICYAGYETYNIRANMSSRNGYIDISNVTVTLAHGTLDIQLFWNRSSDTFMELFDPLDHIGLFPGSCTSTTDFDTKWSLLFVFDVHWSYPQEVLTTCLLNTTSNSYAPRADEFYEVYRVENDLDFVGALTATAYVQGVLSTGDWVLGNETINWTGLTVVYQGSSNIYPDGSAFNVSISDDDTGSWTDSPGSGSQFAIQTQADPQTDPIDIHDIEIIDIPGAGQDVSSVTFDVKTDATPPAPPGGITCFADGPGGGSTEYDNDGTVYIGWSPGDWQDTQSGRAMDAMAYNDPAPTSPSSPGDMAVGVEGVSTFYVRTRDNVGNWGPAGSASILIDLTPIVFTNPIPSPSLWHTTQEVEVGVTITDTGGSGVSGGHIQYRYSNDGLLDTENWEDYPLTTSAQSIQVSKLVDFASDGTMFFQWRAKDVADGVSTQPTTFTPSPIYSVKVDSTAPVMDVVSPQGWQHDTDVEIRMHINDSGGSGIDVTSVEYSVSNDGGASYGGWESAAVQPVGGDLNFTLLQISKEFPEGANNHIKFKASDIAGNLHESQGVQVLVDTVTPSYYDVVPAIDQWNLKDSVTVGITFSENESGLDHSSLEYRTTTTGLDGFTTWKPFSVGSADTPFTVDLRLTFAEGSDNAIQWRISDIADNSLETPPFWIKVDSVGVTFVSPTPDPQIWHTSSSVHCSVTILDEGSGVDVSSLQYSISTSGKYGFGEWKAVDHTGEDGQVVSPSVSVPFPDGESNYIQWRAWDIAGNEPSESEIYQIRVDSTPVSFSNPYPDPSEVYVGVDQVVGITIEDEVSNVDTTTMSYSISLDGQVTWSEWTQVKGEMTGPRSVRVMEEITLLNSRDIFIKWKASDIAGNEIESQPFNIQIDSPPVAVITSPEDGARFNTSSSIDFDAGGSYDPDEGDALTYSWVIDGQSRSDVTFTQDLALGPHFITLKVRDPYGLSSTSSVNITVVEIEKDGKENDTIPDDGKPDATDEVPEEKEGDGGGNLWWLLIVLVIIVVVIIMFLLLRKKKEEVPPQPAAPIVPPYVAPVQGPAVHYQQRPPVMSYPDQRESVYQLPPSYGYGADAPVAALPPAPDHVTAQEEPLEEWDPQGERGETLPYESYITEEGMFAVSEPAPEARPSNGVVEPMSFDDNAGVVGGIPTTNIVSGEGASHPGVIHPVEDADPPMQQF